MQVKVSKMMTMCSVSDHVHDARGDDDDGDGDIDGPHGGTKISSLK